MQISLGTERNNTRNRTTAQHRGSEDLPSYERYRKESYPANVPPPPYVGDSFNLHLEGLKKKNIKANILKKL